MDISNWHPLDSLFYMVNHGLRVKSGVDLGKCCSHFAWTTRPHDQVDLYRLCLNHCIYSTSTYSVGREGLSASIMAFKPCLFVDEMSSKLRIIIMEKIIIRVIKLGTRI